MKHAKEIMKDEYSYLNNRNFIKDAHRFNSCENEVSKTEMWIGNTSGNVRWEKGVDIPKKYSQLSSIRLGRQAYDIKGKPISIDYCLPLIVNKSEQHKIEAIHKREMEEISFKHR